MKENTVKVATVVLVAGVLFAVASLLFRGSK